MSPAAPSTSKSKGTNHIFENESIRTVTPDRMFDVDFYLKLVNGEFANDLNRKVSERDVKTGCPRIVVRLESFFKANPLKGTAQFGHFQPARYFTENVATLKKAVPAVAFDHFEEAFKKLNTLLQ
jgi:hypothetical protein